MSITFYKNKRNSRFPVGQRLFQSISMHSKDNIMISRECLHVNSFLKGDGRHPFPEDGL